MILWHWGTKKWQRLSPNFFCLPNTLQTHEAIKHVYPHIVPDHWSCFEVIYIAKGCVPMEKWIYLIFDRICILILVDALTVWSKSIRRSVRSTLHISPKNLRIQKWSQSGKNGSKHPMLSVSVADNVISYKKSKETLKKPKSLLLQYKFGSWAQKWPKIAKKKPNHSIAMYSIFRCASISWFQVVRKSVSDVLQLAHLQVFQIICIGMDGKF